MKTIFSSMTVAVALLAAAVQQTPAAVLFGTTGAGSVPSTLVLINPDNGALVSSIGPVGFTVNGLAWDAKSKTLFATTSVTDKTFHGLITINIRTGAGTPVNASLVNFGIPIDPAVPKGSPIHSITIDSFGNMVGWYDEVAPATSDTFVKIDKRTGVAKEFPNTGINTAQNGLSFDNHNILWNIDSPVQLPDGTVTQTAYVLKGSGKMLLARPLSPPTAAALGDFNPENNLYYGLNFNVASGTPLEADLVVVNPITGAVTTLGRTVDGLHVIAFARPPLFR
ncbi:MAG: hypothetical protein NT154_40300 [Verrucomicrobia bacterium]|nr:hypothetical protein [Verrucomicrobiota bacterium]